jgi:hypothetical protein
MRSWKECLTVFPQKRLGVHPRVILDEQVTKGQAPNKRMQATRLRRDERDGDCMPC